MAVLPANYQQVVATSGNVAAATAAATIPAVPGRTCFITGFEVTSAGATGASVVLVTVTGIAGGTLNYVLSVVAGATLGNAPLQIEFPAPVPASAVNTAIVVTAPTLGAGNTNCVVNAHGYYL